MSRNQFNTINVIIRDLINRYLVLFVLNHTTSLVIVFKLLTPTNKGHGLNSNR